jgi:chemotaxis protein MotB
MARSSKDSKNDPTDTGILLPPDKKLPVPKSRISEPSLRGGAGAGSVANKTIALVAGGALVFGGVVGFLLRPRFMKDERIGKLETNLAESRKAQVADRDRAATAESELKVAAVAKSDLEKQLETAKKAQTQLADKAAETEKKAKEVDAAQSKLKAAIDKSSGSVSTEGDEIRLQLIDKVLFKVGDDQLTDRGKAVLGKVGKALTDLPDKQIWVQGHTDDSPIVIPPAPKKAPKGTPPPTVRFATNWELSAARALTVVHYLQDTAKIDPSRLAALAFGQYRPVSRSNKAANRRIEIVLYPHRAVIKR